MKTESDYYDNKTGEKKKPERQKYDFWNFLTDFRFYIVLIVVVLWILKEFELIFNH